MPDTGNVDFNRYRDYFFLDRRSVLLLDSKGKILDASQAALDFYGFSREEMASLSFPELYVPGTSETERNTYRRAEINPMEFAAVHRGKSGFPLKLTGILYKTEGTAGEGIVCTFTGRTGEPAGGKTGIDWEEGAARDTLLSRMSHDIRTPVNSILGAVTLLEALQGKEDPRLYYEIIKTSANQLLEAAGNNIELLKKGGGRPVVIREPFNLREALDETIKAFSRDSCRKCRNIRYEFDPFISYELIGDRNRLCRLLMDLAEAAVRCSVNGQVLIRVRKHSQFGERINLQFSITCREKLSGEACTRAGVAREETGTANCYPRKGEDEMAATKELASAINGDIWVECLEDGGCTYYLTAAFLLNAANVKAEQGSEKISPAGRMPGLAQPGDKTILIVEDNEINRMIMRGFINKIGYPHTSVTNGQEAVEAYQRQRPGLILMDIQMPVMNGYDATGVIRVLELDTGFHTPIIAMTAYAMSGDRERCLEGGMDEYLPKPIDFDNLGNLLRKYLQGFKR